MTIYTGETNEQQLKEMLSKGTINVTWKENGDVKSEKHTIDEFVKFINSKIICQNLIKTTRNVTGGFNFN